MNDRTRQTGSGPATVAGVVSNLRGLAATPSSTGGSKSAGATTEELTIFKAYDFLYDQCGEALSEGPHAGRRMAREPTVRLRGKFRVDDRKIEQILGDLQNDNCIEWIDIPARGNTPETEGVVLLSRPQHDAPTSPASERIPSKVVPQPEARPTDVKPSLEVEVSVLRRPRVIYLTPDEQPLLSAILERIGLVQGAEAWFVSKSPVMDLRAIADADSGNQGWEEALKRFVRSGLLVAMDDHRILFRLAVHPEDIVAIPISVRRVMEIPRNRLEEIRAIQQYFDPKSSDDIGAYDHFIAWFERTFPGKKGNSAGVKFIHYRAETGTTSAGLGILHTKTRGGSHWVSVEHLEPYDFVPTDSPRGRILTSGEETKTGRSSGRVASQSGKEESPPQLATILTSIGKEIELIDRQLVPLREQLHVLESRRDAAVKRGKELKTLQEQQEALQFQIAAALKAST